MTGRWATDYRTVEVLVAFVGHSGGSLLSPTLSAMLEWSSLLPDYSFSSLWISTSHNVV